MSFSNTNILFLTLSTLPTSCITFTVNFTLWKLCLCLLKTILERMHSYNTCLLSLQGYIQIKYQFVKSFQKSMQESHLFFCCPIQVQSALGAGASFTLPCLTFTNFLNTNDWKPWVSWPVPPNMQTSKID